uniref:Galactose oxidase n=1 Tax=Lotharella oceanica TaxID=641309 RepID=A0A7S2TVL9_9EUKA|mmetsp:Transcript_31708/g.59117  ORF Transcript_31708/g.59117 Transcript_31708/m.59117 type:complete len:419 (+) Transcript_31708:1-1257(+)
MASSPPQKRKHGEVSAAASEKTPAQKNRPAMTARMQSFLATSSFDSVEWNTLPISGSGPSARSGFCYAEVGNGKMLVVGGVSTSGYCTDSYLLEVTPGGKDSKYRLTGEWKKLSTTGEIPCPRGYPSMVHKNGKVYLFGGVANGFQFLNDMYSLDLKTMRWTRLKPINDKEMGVPLGRCGCGMVACGNLLVITAGLGKGYAHFNDTWAFDMSLSTWLQLKNSSGPAVGSLPPPRRNPATFSCGLEIVTVGGKGADGKSLSDAHSFDLNTYTWRSLPHLMLPTPGAKTTSDEVEPAPRAQNGAAAFQSRIMMALHGGLVEFPCNMASTSLYLRTQGPKGIGTGRWTELKAIGPATTKLARGMHGGILVNVGVAPGTREQGVFVVIFGGTDNRTDLSDPIYGRFAHSSEDINAAEPSARL